MDQQQRMVHYMICIKVVNCTYVPVFGILVPEATNVALSRMRNITVCSNDRIQST